ncbi:MAG: sugar-binding transcriptional regulator [Deltaproteobacteria bacterium]|jgi:deoxyribonucleoside regulator|nr:sugar-binding transcriptional regulator [Deltaproteobacteria bacterium]
MAEQITAADKVRNRRGDYQLATTAIFYYKDGLTQNEIAKRLGVSRATVINYLRLARENGIVDIRINGSSFSANSLAKELKNKFDLEDVYIAAVYHDGSLTESDAEEYALRQVARVAAMALCEIVSPDDILGIAWGKTIQTLAEELPSLSKPGLSVYQMIGSMKSPLLIAAETCAINIARRFSADCYTLHSPAILSTKELAEGLRSEPIIKSQLDQLNTMNRTLFSVGSCLERTHLLQSGIATVKELKWYIKKGAVGVICGRFIDIEGKQIRGPLDERMIGVTPDQLRSAENGILVISGLHKIGATKAAIKGGYVTHLIIDEQTGRALLNAKH